MQLQAELSVMTNYLTVTDLNALGFVLQTWIAICLPLKRAKGSCFFTGLEVCLPVHINYNTFHNGFNTFLPDPEQSNSSKRVLKVSTSELFVYPWTTLRWSNVSSINKPGIKSLQTLSLINQSVVKGWRQIQLLFELFPPPQCSGFNLHSVTTGEFSFFQIIGLSWICAGAVLQRNSAVPDHLWQTSLQPTHFLGREHPFSLLPQTFGNKLILPQSWH